MDDATPAAAATIAAMATDRTPQDLDPHLAERLHQLRRRLGLSVNDMAQRLGLWGTNGADNLRQMERCARPLPGTLQVLLGYMEREQDERRFPPDVPYRSVLAGLSDEERARQGLPPRPDVNSPDHWRNREDGRPPVLEVRPPKR